MPGPEILEYGAFGLLVIVLYVVASWMKRENERKDEISRSEKESRERRDTWIESLVDASKEDAARNTKIWQDMVRSDIESREEMLQALRNVNDSLRTISEKQENACNQQESRHREIMGELHGGS